MPTVGIVFGYRIYFWSNENEEPVHVHICKGKPVSNATKIWITSDGRTQVAHNKSNISDITLRKVRKIIETEIDTILDMWFDKFQYISYFC